MLLSIQPALVRFGPTLVVIAAITLCYGAALGSPLTLHAIHTDDDVVWQFRTDTIEQFAYVQEHGYLPFWIDRRGLGQSAFVGSYHGNFYPLRWLALRLAPRAEEAADWLIWGHMLVAGLATMALARHYGMSGWAAAFAGIFFALGHLPVRWAPFSHAPIHFATYPLAVLGTELIWSGRGRHGAGLLALSLGTSSLGTILYHPHMVFHVVGIIVLYRLLTISVPRRVRLKRLGLSVAAVLLGIAIAVPVLVPFVWEQRGTTREAVAEAGASGMNYFSLTAYVDPRSLQIGDHVYMGPLAPALMLVGLLVSLRRRRLALLPLLVVLALLIGFKTPLLDLLQQMVPGWSAVSNVRRLSFVMVLPLALMAGLGLDWLRNSRRKGQTIAIVGALIGTSLMFWWLHMTEWGLWRSPALWLGLIATALIAFLLHASLQRTAATGSASGAGGARAYRSTFAIIGTLVGTSLMVWLGWWLRVAGLERPALVPVLGVGLVAITLSVYLLYKSSLHRLADGINTSLPALAMLGALVGASVAFCWLRVTELGRLALIPALWLGAAPGACPPTWGRLGLIPVLWLGVITTAPIAFLLRKTSRHRLAADPHTSLPILVLLGVLVGAGLMVWWLRMAELGLEQGLSPALWLGLVAMALIVTTAPIVFLLYKKTPLQAADSSRASLLVLVLVFGVSLLALGVERQLRWRPVPDKPLPEFVDTLALVAGHNDPAGRWMSFSIQMHESYMPNVFLEVPGRWLDTYESFRPPEFFTYWRTLTGSTQYDQRREGLGSLWYMHTLQDPTPNANLVNAAGITRVLGSSDRIAEAEQLGWSLLGDQGILRVYHNPQAFPMAYGSRRWESAPPDAAIARIATAEQGSFDRHTDYVDGVTPVASPGEDPLPARVVRPSAEEVQVMLVAPSQAPVLMVLLDSYHPDWQALVDGERRPVLRVNGVFRGVLLEPGETQVTFRFEPRWFPWLPTIAAAVALVTVLLLLPIGLMRRTTQRVLRG